MSTKTTQELSPKVKANRIAKLKAQLAELGVLEENAPIKKSVTEEIISSNTISQDEYIPVMSLVPHHLNLSTKGSGQGDVKKFTKFGEIKRILYRDLLDIIESHRNFMEAGLFYIMNPIFIRQQGLDDVYSKILTREKIEDILTTSSSDCVALYLSANEKQQEIIIRLLTDRVRDNPDSVDLNIIDSISRISKVDIVKRAEESKALRKETLEEEQAANNQQ